MRHQTPSDAWIVIDKVVYDVSGWQASRGADIILENAGYDATEILEPSNIVLALKRSSYSIGALDGDPVPPPVEEIDDEPQISSRRDMGDYFDAFGCDGSGAYLRRRRRN